MGVPEKPVVDTDSIVTAPTTITISWGLPPDVTGSEVSWELTEQTRRRRQVRNAERGTSGQLPADHNSYTIDKLRSGTSYDITVTVFNPAGSSSTTFTRSTEGGSEFHKNFTILWRKLWECCHATGGNEIQYRVSFIPFMAVTVAESTSCECDNTSAIIGGVVAVVLIIATSLTVIVVVILVLRSRSGKNKARPYTLTLV